MTKLHELLQQKVTNGSFGIEIETEGKNLCPIVLPQWKIEDDGSLRGAFPNERAEYVLKKPLDLQKAIDAVVKLRQTQDDNNATLDFSFRTSVHVHVNVQQLTFNQYLNMIYTYLLLEEPLVRYCGKERIGNRFCLRLQDAEGLIDYLFMLFRQGQSSMRHIHGDAVRYASLNIAATSKYGSLEFRSLKGNMDVDYITTWLQALDHLRSFAQEYKNPQEIHDLFVKSEPTQFAETVLGDVFESFAYPEMEMDMRSSFSLTLELPYNFRDYSEEDKQLLAMRKERLDRQNKEIEELIERQNRQDELARRRAAERRIPAPRPEQIVPVPFDIGQEIARERAVVREGQAMAERAVARRRGAQIIVDDVMVQELRNHPANMVDWNANPFEDNIVAAPVRAQREW